MGPPSGTAWGIPMALIPLFTWPPPKDSDYNLPTESFKPRQLRAILVLSSEACQRLAGPSRFCLTDRTCLNRASCGPGRALPLLQEVVARLQDLLGAMLGILISGSSPGSTSMPKGTF